MALAEMVIPAPTAMTPRVLVKSDKFCVAFQSGSCKFGAACRFKHETDPTFDPAGAALQGPGGIGQKPCHAFQRGGALSGTGVAIVTLWWARLRQEATP